MVRDAIILSTSDNVVVSLAVYRGEAVARKVAVVVCPGFFQSKDTAIFQRLSRELARDYDVAAMDFRGHGRSSGFYTFSAKEGADLEAVLNWATSRYESIGVIGFSLGGAIAINTLSRAHEKVRSIIAVSAPATFEEIEFKWWMPEAMRTGLQGLGSGAGCRPGNLFLKKERPIDRVRELVPIPVLFIHGTRDVIVGENHSHRLYVAAGDPKRIEIIEGGSHAQALYRDDPQGFIHIVRSWLTQTL